MNWLDLLAGTVLILAFLQGYRNGFIKALISFFSLLIGVVLAFQLAGFVAGLLKEYTKITSYWLPFISFLLVLLAVMIGLRWLTRILQQTADWLMLGWLNKLLGMVLYIFIYGTMLSSFIYFMNLLGVIEKSKMDSSISYSYLANWWPYFMAKLSEWLPFIKQTLGQFSTQLQEKVL
jgi:membrane protein required for colicin V production